MSSRPKEFKNKPPRAPSSGSVPGRPPRASTTGTPAPGRPPPRFHESARTRTPDRPPARPPARPSAPPPARPAAPSPTSAHNAPPAHRRATDAVEHFFATCPRGLEAALASELTTLGAANARATDGGVAFEGRYALAYTVNLWSRLASRVLWQVGFGRYRDQQDIYDTALKINWPNWFDVTRTIRVNVTAVRSPLASLDFITLKIKDAIVDRFRTATGERPSIDTAQPDVRVHAFLTGDTSTFYIDTSGEALFKRGYRHTDDDLRVEAPLRENLAAGMLALSGWAAETPLLDPFCGGGTIVIEAAMLAADIAPGLGRSFGFEQLSWHDADQWQRVRDDAARRAEGGRRTANVRIAGSDIDRRAIESARANAEAAGVTKLIDLQVGNALATTAPFASGAIITNPPYGFRLGVTEELRLLYAAYADTLKRHFAGWNAWILCGELSLVKAIRLSPARRTPIFNGAIECRLVEYRLVSGSNRPDRGGKGVGGGKITSSSEGA